MISFNGGIVEDTSDIKLVEKVCDATGLFYPISTNV